MKTIRSMIVATVFLGLFAFVFVQGVHAQSNDAVKIDSGTGTKPAVTFPHAKHKERLAGKCADCHTTPPALKDNFKKVEGFKNAFHDTCVVCHKEGGKGPTACADCHK